MDSHSSALFSNGRDYITLDLLDGPLQSILVEATLIIQTACNENVSGQLESPKMSQDMETLGSLH
jgi:hypothetical protein